jgi:hypothetical protein
VTGTSGELVMRTRAGGERLEPMPRALIALAAVGVLGAAAAVWMAAGRSHPPAHGMLSIVSTPAGATLTIAGKDVGTTPYFADNAWAGEVVFRVSKPGYRTAEGTFEGGREQRHEVVLTRKKAGRAVDAGQADSVEVEFDGEVTIDDHQPLHRRGPLRPPEPTEFVDEDLDREARQPKQ